MAEVNRVKSLFILNVVFLFTLSNSLKALEVIRDTELESFTNDIIKMLLVDSDIEAEDINIYFLKSNQVNAFVTGGKNIFINTELIILKVVRKFGKLIIVNLCLSNHYY